MAPISQLPDSHQNDDARTRPEKAPTISKEKWSELKPIIYEQYIVGKRSFVELMKFMKDNHDFNATDAQYRVILREWKFFKNKKADKRAGSPEEEQTREKRPRLVPEHSHLEDPAPPKNPPFLQSEAAQNTNTPTFPASSNGSHYPDIDLNLLEFNEPLGSNCNDGNPVQYHPANSSDSHNYVPLPDNFLLAPNTYPPAAGLLDFTQSASYWPQLQSGGCLPGQNSMQSFGSDAPPSGRYNKTPAPATSKQVYNYNSGNFKSQPSRRNHNNGNDTCTNTSTQNQPIHHAAQAGSLENIKFLLENAPAYADVPGTDGVTALWIAAQQGHTKIVKLLIDEYHVNVDTAVTDSKRTPIHQAAQGGYTSIVELLLDSSANPDPRDNGNVTPLWSAAQQGYYKIVDMLLDKGADKNAASEDGSRRPIHQAAQNGHTKVVELLLLHKATPDPIDDNSITPLWSAAQEGHHQIVKMLLDYKVDPEVTSDDGSRRPIHQAAQNGHLKTVEILLRHNANANPEKDSFDTKVPSPLWLAAQNGNAEIAKLLIEKGADVNFSISPSRRCPLHQAAQSGNTELVRLLIKYNAEVDAGEEDGWPPMMIAAQQGHIEIVSLLIDGGANVNSEEKDGATPLWIASQQGHADIVKKLLAQGARNFATKTSLRQPIHQAAQNGHLEVVKLLVDHDGESVHVKDKKGSTPLCLASQGKGTGRLTMMKYLHSKGAKIINNSASLVSA